MNRPCIIVPVYNHPHSLDVLVEGLEPFDVPTLMINDGSDELCTRCLRQIDRANEWITLIERPCNGGKGAAVKTGLRAAALLGFTHALQVDADGQHDLDDLPRLLQLSQSNPEAVICGYPTFENIPSVRLYGRYLTHVWVWINTLSLDIRDSMCGFRVYPLSHTLAEIDQSKTGDRMEFDPEILVRLHWRGLRVIEIPTRVSYPQDGISHFQSFRDNLLISWAHTRLFFGMLRRLPELLRRRRYPLAREY
ncbi:MAG: glycosyltransferase family 2 protein [Halioglobus sp.]|nr:glycosyltransferase family 2 protein [Halioglobus sp.]